MGRVETPGPRCKLAPEYWEISFSGANWMEKFGRCYLGRLLGLVASGLAAVMWL